LNYAQTDGNDIPHIALEDSTADYLREPHLRDACESTFDAFSLRGPHDMNRTSIPAKPGICEKSRSTHQRSRSLARHCLYSEATLRIGFGFPAEIP
jgi:hypothetical protein